MSSRPTTLFLLSIATVTISCFTLSAEPSRGFSKPSGSLGVRMEPDGENGAPKVFQSPLLHDDVKNQIEYLTTNQRARFQTWLDRSVRYVPLMKEIFREYDLPEDLVYIAMIESGFNPHAVSRRHAVGLWQFMGPTGKEYGLVTDQWIDERRDPIKSTRVAAAYLRDLYNRFGAWPLALASYNAGPGKVRSAVRRSGSDDYWDARVSRFFRQETRTYVPQYMAALIIAKNPDAFGFTVPSNGPFQYDEIIVKQSIDLGVIAWQAGCSYDELRELNPELVGKSTPSGYVLRVPKGTGVVQEIRAAKLFRTLTARVEPAEDENAFSLFIPVHSPDDAIFDTVCPLDIPPFGGQPEAARTLTCADGKAPSDHQFRFENNSGAGAVSL